MVQDVILMYVMYLQRRINQIDLDWIIESCAHVDRH